MAYKQYPLDRGGTGTVPKTAASKKKKKTGSSGGAELLECQRYYQRVGSAVGIMVQGIAQIISSASKTIRGVVNLPTTLRSAPTISFSGTINAYTGSAAVNTVASVSTPIYSNTGVAFNMVLNNSLTSGNVYYFATTAGSYIEFSADL